MLKIMENPKVWMIFIDLGYPRYEEFKKLYPKRVINTGASEQTALDLAVGLAYADKTPFIYTITPFYFRAFETIRTYINKESLGVVLIGAGRDDDYSKTDGFSHYAGDDDLFQLSKFKSFYPESKGELQKVLESSIYINAPRYINLSR